MSRRALVAGGVLAAAAAALALLALAGRWERRDYVTETNRSIERVRAAVGPLDSPRLMGYRVLPQLDCLAYRAGANPFALELCVDPAGRVVEAIDRRGGVRRYYSLRPDPSDASVRLDSSRVAALLRKMRASS